MNIILLILLVHEITEPTTGKCCRIVKKNQVISAIDKSSDFKKEGTFFLCKIAQGLPEKRIIRGKDKQLLTLPNG